MPDSLPPAAPAFEQILRQPLRVHRQAVNNGRLVQVLDRDSRVLAVMKNAAEPKEAVANLFVAAPQMLAALKKAQEFIRNGIESGYIRMPAFEADTAHDTPPMIDAAIAKAEGRSNA